jgi:ech hydrogenase subunit D
MGERQETVVIDIPKLVEQVRRMRVDGFRLVQISATRLAAGFELNYSFDKAYLFANYRITFADQKTLIPSVSGEYWSAFLYENEINDLFGIPFEGIAVDYAGKFYRTSVKAPFGEKK